MTTTTQTSRRRLGRSLWVAIGVAMAATLGAGTLLTACGSGDTEISETIDPIAEANAAGNVALCNDGNFSDNTEFRATCSGGDGVDRWLATYGECSDGSTITMSSDAACPDGAEFARLLPVDFEPEQTTTTTVVPTTSTIEVTTSPPTTAPAPTSPVTTAPPATPPPTTAPPATSPPTTAPPAPTNVYYANCAAVRAAGAAPIYRGDPGYSSDLDRDGDGVACEN